MERLLRAGRVCLGVSALAWALGGPSVAFAGHGSSGGSSGGSHGSSGGSSGGYSNGSSGGSSGGYSHGSSGGSSGGSHGSWGGSHGSSGGSSGGVVVESPAAAAARTQAKSSVRLTVMLPAEAKLFIEDQPTQQTGARRDFISPQLKAGQTYVYTLKVQLQHNGSEITKTEQVNVTPGQRAVVEFGLSSDGGNALVASRR